MISPKNLYNFHQEMFRLVDKNIVNAKQNEAMKYQIEKLMNVYFLFEMPEEEI